MTSVTRADGERRLTDVVKSEPDYITYPQKPKLKINGGRGGGMCPASFRVLETERLK